MNRHDFQLAVRQFRSGRISLNELTEQMYPEPKQTPDDSEPFSLPRRKPDSHKGDYGRVLLIGGSRGMAGSISLSSIAALRSGSGLVSAVIPACISHEVAGFNPCLMTIPCSDDDTGFSIQAADEIQDRLEKADVVAVGPGMGTRPGACQLVKSIFQQITGPVVVDADALNVLASENILLAEHAGPRVLTPHPGEFARLTGATFSKRADEVAAAVTLAQDSQTIIVLKGSRTVVTDGKRTFENTTGNPGMATGGTGDVLTGMIASFIGQGLDPFDASALGVHLHGMAGDIAAMGHGEASMIATDLIESIGTAIRQLPQR